MNKIIAVVLMAWPYFVMAGGPESNIFNDFVDEYIEAIKGGDKDQLSKLTLSENIDIHLSNLRILNQVKNEPYIVGVVPYDLEDSGAVALFINASNGRCRFAKEPTHELNVDWQITSEHYHAGHACYAKTLESFSITLFVQESEGKITEVSSCSTDYKVPAAGQAGNARVNLSDKENAQIKAWLQSQDYFSTISSLKHVSKNYGLSVKQAKMVVESICQEL